jgi:hypothetical protein
MIQPTDLLKKQFSQEINRPGKTGVDWYLFCYFLELTKKSPAIEFGVGNGGSLFTMIAINDNITAIDSWSCNWQKKDVELILTNLNKKIFWIDGDSTQLTPTNLKKYGFVHLDANKSFDGTLADLNLANKICTNLICVDDYMSSLWPEVTWAVDSWLENNPGWKRVLVGNHQVFLSQKSVDIKELVVTMPLINRHDTWYISYGQYDECVIPFITNSKMTYSWHNITTSDNKLDW